MLGGQITKLRQRRTAPLILELDLTQGILEGPPADPVAALLARHKTRLADVLDGLRRARQDNRVKAVVAKVGGQHIGLATVQELWKAISRSAPRASRRSAWAESFGEFWRGNLPYYLATAFDQINLQPSGSLGLTGIVVEQLFLRSALDKIGVNFEAAQRQEYKTAAHPLTERGFAGPAREENEHLAQSVADQLTSAIAERRGRPRPTRGPCSTAARSYLARPWTRGSSTRWGTATRRTPPSVSRPARARYCGPSALPADARPGAAGPQAAEPPGTLRRCHLRHRADPAGPEQPGPLSG